MKKLTESNKILEFNYKNKIKFEKVDAILNQVDNDR